MLSVLVIACVLCDSVLVKNADLHLRRIPSYQNLIFLSDMSSLTLEDIDSVSEVDRDTLAPLPPPSWNNVYHNPYGPSPAYIPPPPPGAYIPPKPYNYPPNETASYVSMPQGNGSIHSGSGE